MGTPEPVDSERVLQDWLVRRLSLYLGCQPGRIGVDVPIAEYGMDSVASLSLVGDIEAEFGLSLESTLAWDYPTVTALAGLLSSRLPAPLGAA